MTPRNPNAKPRANAVKPSPDGKCLCGCGNICLPGRAFYTNTCQKRFHRRRYENQTGRQKVLSYHPSTEVLIHDPKVALPYYIKRSEWAEYAEAYRSLGCEAEMGTGQEVLL